MLLQIFPFINILNTNGITAIIPIQTVPKNLIVNPNISLKKLSLSSDSIFKAADSVQVKLNTLYNVDTTPENLLAAEYMPFCAIPNIVDIIILSDALTIHQESILGTSGTEYLTFA